MGYCPSWYLLSEIIDFEEVTVLWLESDSSRLFVVHSLLIMQTLSGVISYINECLIISCFVSLSSHAFEGQADDLWLFPLMLWSVDHSLYCPPQLLHKPVLLLDRGASLTRDSSRCFSVHPLDVRLSWRSQPAAQHQCKKDNIDPLIRHWCLMNSSCWFVKGLWAPETKLTTREGKHVISLMRIDWHCPQQCCSWLYTKTECVDGAAILLIKRVGGRRKRKEGRSKPGEGLFVMSRMQILNFIDERPLRWVWPNHKLRRKTEISKEKKENQKTTTISYFCRQRTVGKPETKKENTDHIYWM